MNLVIKYKKINLKATDLIALLLMLTSMLRPFQPSGIRQLFFLYRACTMGIVFIYYMLNKKSKKSLLPILIFAISIIFSSIYNQRSIENKLISLSESLLYINMFLLLDNLVGKYEISEIITVIKRVLFIYLIINDISTFFTPISNNSFYFIGTKFVVSYLHMFYLGLMMYKLPELKQPSKVKIIFFYLYSLFIIGRIECSTGLIGMSFMLILWLITRKKDKFFSPKNILLIIFICFIVFVNLTYLLELPFIQNIIVNVLGRDLTLTGRMKIYENLNVIISNSPWFGYGYENIAVANLVGYGNTQNGIYEILVNYGFFGLIGFLVCVFVSCRKIKETTNLIKPFNAMMIVLTIISIVEISFNYYFIFCLAMIYAIKNNKLLDKENKNENWDNVNAKS